MSLGRVSYLESWEHHPPPFIRRPSFGDGAASGDEESINRHSRTQSPDPHFFPSSLPSSFPSRAVRHRLSFNPVAGRGWAHSFATEPDEEQRPLFRSDVSPDLTIRDAGPARLAEEDVFQDPKWDTAETTPAFEVNSGKRIRRLYVSVSWCIGANYKIQSRWLWRSSIACLLLVQSLGLQLSNRYLYERACTEIDAPVKN